MFLVKVVHLGQSSHLKVLIVLYFYLLGKGGYVFGSVGLFVCLFVCLSVDNIILYFEQRLFVCVCVCSLSPPRSFDGSLPNLVAVCRWTSELPLRGSFSKRLTGHFHFHYIIYAPG